MGVDLSKKTHVILFCLVFPLLSACLVYVIHQLQALIVPHQYSFFIDGIGGISSYVLIYAYFNKRAWKWKLFKLTGITTVPDLSGNWEGEIHSNFDEKIRIPAQLQIVQTFSSIRLAMKFKSSKSNSILAGFIRDSSDNLELHFSYHNEPCRPAPNGMHAHYGAVRIFSISPKSMEGDYYNENDHGRGHLGKLVFEKVDN